MDFQEYGENVRGWVNEVYRSRGIDAERTLKSCQEIEEYARSTNDAKLLGFAYYYSGETYYGLNDGENLFKYITKAITYLDQSQQWELVARAYNIMAITSSNRGNAPIAMDYYLTGLNYCKKYHTPEIEGIINLNLGTLYMNYGQHNDALQYFERSYQYFKDNKENEEYKVCRICLYVSMGKCYMLRGMMEKAQEYSDLLDQECAEDMNSIDWLCVYCFKVSLYHMQGKISMRDEMIHEIHSKISEDFAIMDIFDDLHDLCSLLLELDFGDVFWDIIHVLESLTKRAKIINLERRIIALKIKYYRAHHDNAGYLQAAGLYYELTERMEKENQYMIMNMIQVRNSLELANEKRKTAEEANQRLVQKSETDQLTGLANRYRLNDYSEKAFVRCLKNRQPLAVEILDIDYFKQFNDNYGHQAGDKCIAAIAQQLKKMQNDSVFCARYGGDEFIIIYENMTREEVLDLSSALRSNIVALGMEHQYSLAHSVVTISQGICYDIPQSENKNWDFLHTADMMLYRVKKQSRNSICMGDLSGGEVCE